MCQRPPTSTPLSPPGALVVPGQAGPALTAEGLHGRVEPIVSGQAAVLTSLEALRAFMAQVLTDPGPPPGGAAGASGAEHASRRP